MNNIETRMFVCDINTRENVDKNKKELQGVPIVFNKRTDLGWWDEVIESSALDKADMKDVRFLVNHDTKQLPLARSRNNNANSTMQLSVDSNGLNVRVDLDTENNARAMELYSAVSRGDVSGMSFMFTVEKDSWEALDTDHPIRHIEQIGKVYEVSAVTFPAYEQTSINARSLDNGQASLDSARKALESARKIEEKRSNILERLDKLNDKKA